MDIVPELFEPLPEPKQRPLQDGDVIHQKVDVDPYLGVSNYIIAYDEKETKALVDFVKYVEFASKQARINAMITYIEGGMDAYIRQLRGIYVGVYIDPRHPYNKWINVRRIATVLGLNKKEVRRTLAANNYAMIKQSRANRTNLDNLLSDFRIKPDSWFCYRK